jgi:hypothetical protein
MRTRSDLRSMPFKGGWWVVLLCIAFNLPAFAQTGREGPQPRDGGTREVLVSIFIPSIPNAPFSATVSTESIRQLGDGSRIRLVNHRAIARDAAGRVFQERRLLVPDDGKHESVVTQIEIQDPLGHNLYICRPREQVCQRETFTAEHFAPPVRTAGQEDLGTQVIEGLETVGIRETNVIAAGAIGNESPIQTVREFWYSAKLGLNLSSKLQDPRLGSQTFEVTNITLGAPDAQLFKVPAKFQMIDLRGTAGDAR